MAARRARDSSPPSIHAILPAEKYGSRNSPLFSLAAGSNPSARIWRQIVGGAAVLPDNRAPDGLAARALPQQSRLALIGDADGGDVGGARAGFGDRFARGGEERFPDVFRIVLDPARARKMLREFALREGDRAQIGIEQNRPRRSRALIERENKRRFHCFGRRAVARDWAEIQSTGLQEFCERNSAGVLVDFDVGLVGYHSVKSVLRAEFHF